MFRQSMTAEGFDADEAPVTDRTPSYSKYGSQGRFSVLVLGSKGPSIRKNFGDDSSRKATKGTTNPPDRSDTCSKHVHSLVDTRPAPAFPWIIRG